MKLFGRSGGTPIQAPQEIPPAEAMAPAAPVPWFEVLKSLLFWGILLAILVISISYYLREHRGVWLALQKLPVVAGLKRFVDWLRGWLGGVNRQVAAAVVQGFQRLRMRLRGQAASHGWGFVNLRKLSPRQRVLFYYLAMVRRGGERGYTRQAGQTPYEYSQVLMEALQEEGRQEGQAEMGGEVAGAPPAPAPVDEVSQLTGNFVEARYSLHTVTEGQASLVKRYWDKIRRALVGARHGLGE